MLCERPWTCSRCAATIAANSLMASIAINDAHLGVRRPLCLDCATTELHRRFEADEARRAKLRAEEGE
jgi:hypothetical protein